jgi:hypothetical protein
MDSIECLIIFDAAPGRQGGSEAAFDRLVSWARYGDLFAYDDKTETLAPQ